ncbi:hypothetical protein PVAP13_7NG285424 [Panicum virgatum]|uniref:Uncharacterized protein n=1 Tax=Panicum virgatum TaxID=38727 RepID=A0A8T0Q1J6_PANVG|nr:hypothetical protein PVAP13_7NG285424 [Panicum virgatum]
MKRSICNSKSAGHRRSSPIGHNPRKTLLGEEPAGDVLPGHGHALAPRSAARPAAAPRSSTPPAAARSGDRRRPAVPCTPNDKVER